VSSTQVGQLAALLLRSSILAAAGLTTVTAVFLVRALLHKTWRPPFFVLVSSFLAGTAIPYAFVLIMFPFATPQPDLSQVSYYVPLAGIALLWAGARGIGDGIRSGVNGSSAGED